MWGISTNFGCWVFTKYNKRDEMLQCRNPFLLTESIELMDLQSFKIKEEELQKLVLLLDMLATDIINASLNNKWEALSAQFCTIINQTK